MLTLYDRRNLANVIKSGILKMERLFTDDLGEASVHKGSYKWKREAGRMRGGDVVMDKMSE